jgi:hypothetical protein
MTAMTAARPATESTWKYKRFTLKSGTKAFLNGAACLELATGKVVPAVSTGGTGLVYLGLFAETVDATAADQLVNVDLVSEVRLKLFVNATAGDAVLATDVGKIAYFLDDQTVTITRDGRAVAGRIWEVTSAGVRIEKLPSIASDVLPTISAPAFVANDSVLTSVVSGAIYDIPATGAASTVTLPAASPDGTSARFVADGTKNAHTVQYRDATGPVNLTTALTAAKRHLVIVTKSGGKWFANAYISP